MPLTSGEISRLLDPYQLPHDDLRFDGRAWRNKRDVLKGAGVLASGVIGVGKYALNKMSRLGSSQGYSTPAGKRATPKNLTVDINGEGVAEMSVNNTQRKVGKRGQSATNPADIIERPMRIPRPTKGATIQSAWKSLRDLVSGKRIIKNAFSFKVTSERDKRGLMAIPLRHDANVPLLSGTPTDTTQWTVGVQTPALIPGYTEGTPSLGPFSEYATMMTEPPLQVPPSGATSFPTAPSLGKESVIIPRLNLPTLEQASWDLNGFKIMPPDHMQDRLTTTGGDGFFPLVTPVNQLASTQLVVSGNTNNMPNQYPAAWTSMARKQATRSRALVPNLLQGYQPPRFKTQLGPGKLTMRMCNQSTCQVTVEMVVLKVRNPHWASTQTDSTSVAPLAASGNEVNMSKLWRNLYDTVGYEYLKEKVKTPGFAMGAPIDGASHSGPQASHLQWDSLGNPYKPFLPSKFFKARGDFLQGASSTTNVGGYTLSGQNNNGAVSSGVSDVNSLTSGLSGARNLTGQPGSRAGQLNPYKEVSRSYCTIRSSGERVVSIQLPSSVYDATKIAAGGAGSTSTTVIDGLPVAAVSTETYIVCISVNGAVQDVFEPAVDSVGAVIPGGPVRIIGKAYCDCVIDVHAQYQETVYPSVCDYSSLPITKYNLGEVRDAQTEPSEVAFTGKILAMANTIPVSQNGILKTGKDGRAQPN